MSKTEPGSHVDFSAIFSLVAGWENESWGGYWVSTGQTCACDDVIDAGEYQHGYYAQGPVDALLVQQGLDKSWLHSWTHNASISLSQSQLYPHAAPSRCSPSPSSAPVLVSEAYRS